MRKVPALLVLGILGGALPVSGQEPPAIELSGGYQWLEARKGEFSSAYPLGWYADAAYDVNTLVGIVAQAGGGYDRRESRISNEGVIFSTTGDLGIHEVMGDIRLNDRRSTRAVWFVQALAGGVRVSANVTGTATGPRTNDTFSQTISESRTYFGLQFGGGVNLALFRRVGARVGLDVLRIFHPGEGNRTIPFFVGDGTDAYRVTAGIVLSFARR